MKTRLPIFLALLCLAPLVAFAQSNDIVDRFLSQKQALVADAAYLAVVGGGHLPETATPSEAFAFARDKGWLGKGLEESAPIPLDALCLLVMRSLKVPGGIMFRLLPTKRFAFKDLVAYGVVNPTGGSSRTLGGEEALSIIGKASALKGGS